LLLRVDLTRSQIGSAMSLLAHPTRSAYGRFLAFSARNGLIWNVSNGSI
jgi:hypothetical protein